MVERPSSDAQKQPRNAIIYATLPHRSDRPIHRGESHYPMPNPSSIVHPPHALVYHAKNRLNPVHIQSCRLTPFFIRTGTGLLHLHFLLAIVAIPFRYLAVSHFAPSRRPPAKQGKRTMTTYTPSSAVLLAPHTPSGTIPSRNRHNHTPPSPRNYTHYNNNTSTLPHDPRHRPPSPHHLPPPPPPAAPPITAAALVSLRLSYGCA